MDCGKCREYILSDFSDNELKPKDAGEFKEHLSACGACREFYSEAESKVLRPLRAFTPIQPDESAWEGIKNKISNRGGNTFFENLGFNGYLRYWGYAAAAAAAVLVIVFSFARRPAEDNMVFAESFIRENVEYVSSLSYNGTEEQPYANDFGTGYEIILF